jgi:lysozyme family protein
MADFEHAFRRTLDHEGGYALTQTRGDRGGQTFAGISRRYHPDWTGWQYIDHGRRAGSALDELVARFYRDEFWARMRGDGIRSQRIANSIYDFAVNAGVMRAVRLAQGVVGVKADGILGPQTMAALNEAPADFVLRYALAKIDHYNTLARRDATQQRFLCGWINRALAGVALH